MRLLAIDTALAACSTAFYDSDRGIPAGETLKMVRGHAEALMPQIARVMAKADIDFTALDRIAVTIGPGSFTGLRVGVAAARGLAAAAHKPAVGVSTLTAMAMPLIVSDDSKPVVVVIDARNDQAYMQAFGEKGRELTPPPLAPPGTVFDGLPEGAVRVIGSAARKLAALGLRETIVEEGDAPEIAWVAALGATAPADVPPKPLYLRAPDAKPQQIGHLLQK